jgi:hypothetical protein
LGRPFFQEFSSFSMRDLKSLAGSSDPIFPSNLGRLTSEEAPFARIASISSPETGLISSTLFRFASFFGGTLRVSTEDGVERGATFLDVERFDEIFRDLFGPLDEFGRGMRILCKDIYRRWKGLIRMHCPEPNDLINPMQKRGISIFRPQILCRIPIPRQPQTHKSGFGWYPFSSCEKVMRFILST